MVLKFNLSSLKKNKILQFGTRSFRVISSRKLFFKHQGKKQATVGKKIDLKKYNVKNCEVLLTLFFEIILSDPL